MIWDVISKIRNGVTLFALLTQVGQLNFELGLGVFQKMLVHVLPHHLYKLGSNLLHSFLFLNIKLRFNCTALVTSLEG